MSTEEHNIKWATLKTQVINSNRVSGKFTPATVEYWLEWLEAKTIILPSAEAILTWIADMEYEIGHVIDSELPSEWIPND